MYVNIYMHIHLFVYYTHVYKNTHTENAVAKPL